MSYHKKTRMWIYSGGQWESFFLAINRSWLTVRIGVMFECVLFALCRCGVSVCLSVCLGELLPYSASGNAFLLASFFADWQKHSPGPGFSDLSWNAGPQGSLPLSLQPDSEESRLGGKLVVIFSCSSWNGGYFYVDHHVCRDCLKITEWVN